MKPRLRRRDGQWECSSVKGLCTTVGRGENPFAAWMNWLKLSLSQYDFETP